MIYMWFMLKPHVKIMVFAVIVAIMFSIILIKVYYDKAYSTVSLYSLSVNHIVYYRGNNSLHIFSEIVFIDDSVEEIIVNYLDLRVYLYIDTREVFLGETLVEAPVLKPGLNRLYYEIILPVSSDVEGYIHVLSNRSSAQIHVVMDYSYSYYTLNVHKVEDIYSYPFDPSRIMEFR